MKSILNLTLILALAAGAAAQEPKAASATTANTTTATATTSTAEPATSNAPRRLDPDQERAVRSELREDFMRVLQQHPPLVGKLVALDPTLLSNDQFLSRYPDLQVFVAQNAEIRRNPHYYVRLLDDPNDRPIRRTPLDEALETFSIIATFVLIFFVLAWLVRTIIEQKRWSHLSKRQTEVHGRILDRFATNEEVLEYIKSPAGSRFLESAPIAVHNETKPSGPMTRVMWSIHLGVIIAAAGAGMLVVAARLASSGSEGFFALGMISFCVGAGFIISAIISMAVSRRFGIWQEGNTTNTVGDTGVMR